MVDTLVMLSFSLDNRGRLARYGAKVLLSIEQAAARLGKSARQVRYMVKTGKLPARRDGARWVIESDTLPRSSGQEQAAERRSDRLRAAVEEALDLGGRRRRYSVRDLRAFQVGLPLLEAAALELGPEHAAGQALRSTLEHLARGCHRFQNADKATAYCAARDAASPAGLGPSRKLRRHLAGKLRTAARRPAALIRCLRSYRGLLSFG